jgi:hypothetical protein
VISFKLFEIIVPHQYDFFTSEAYPHGVGSQCVIFDARLLAFTFETFKQGF